MTASSCRGWPGTEDETPDGLLALLREQPCRESLLALGFRPADRSGTAVLHWSGHHDGVELYVFAGPDMFGRWQLTGRMTSKRELMWSEKVLMDREPFGAVALKVLALWTEAFGNAAPPTDLQCALVYRQHLQDMRPLCVAAPTLWADGEVLRAIRRWLAGRASRDAEGEIPGDIPLELSFANGMLRLTAIGQSYGCPAQGVWVADCRVSLRQFCAAAARSWRGGSIRLEQMADRLSVAGHDLPVLDHSPDAESL